MYLRGKCLPRRTLLRGLGGAALSLPFLSAMAPAAKAQPAVLQPKRWVFVYFPHGQIAEHWTPKATGRAYEMTAPLAPLAQQRERMSVLTGLCCDPSRTFSGFHDRGIASLMTGVEMSQKEIRVGQSIDQLAAPYLSKDSALRSLELGVESSKIMVGPVFKTATNPVPFEESPRAVFERIFGDVDSLDPVVLAQYRQQQKSMLDLVLASAADLKRDLGAADKIKLDQYLESVREIEHKVNMPDRVAATNLDIKRPSGVPTVYSEYVKLMFDLQVAALQADVMRVSTFSLGAEASNMDFPEIGWRQSHHLTSHHGGQPAKRDAMTRINGFHAGLFNYMLDRMQKIDDGEGSLLDSTAVVYFSSLGDADRHMQVDLPVVLAGGTNMGFKHGRHIKFPENTPITNLYVTMLDRAGIPIEKFGDSTGDLPALTAA